MQATREVADQIAQLRENLSVGGARLPTDDTALAPSGEISKLTAVLSEGLEEKRAQRTAEEAAERAAQEIDERARQCANETAERVKPLQDSHQNWQQPSLPRGMSEEHPRARLRKYQVDEAVQTEVEGAFNGAEVVDVHSFAKCEIFGTYKRNKTPMVKSDQPISIEQLRSRMATAWVANKFRAHIECGLKPESGPRLLGVIGDYHRKMRLRKGSTAMGVAATIEDLVKLYRDA